MGSPSIFVYDCSNAGLVVKSFRQFALQREQELEVRLSAPGATSSGLAGALWRDVRVLASALPALLEWGLLGAGGQSVSKNLGDTWDG